MGGGAALAGAAGSSGAAGTTATGGASGAASAGGATASGAPGAACSGRRAKCAAPAERGAVGGCTMGLELAGGSALGAADGAGTSGSAAPTSGRSAGADGSGSSRVGERTTKSVNAAAMAAEPSAAHSTKRRVCCCSARRSPDSSSSRSPHAPCAVAGATASAVVGASEPWTAGSADSRINVVTGSSSSSDSSSRTDWKCSGESTYCADWVSAAESSFADSMACAGRAGAIGTTSAFGATDGAGGRELLARRSWGTSSTEIQLRIPTRQTSACSDNRPLRSASTTSKVVIGATSSSATFTNHSPRLARFDGRWSLGEPTPGTIAKSAAAARYCGNPRDIGWIGRRNWPWHESSRAILAR